ncbi:MAG: endolytic transglycosylase MltG [Deltaproteobacteria bacterium]|nr:endolytic transglycosylase MltG [Deltaproteobacteria bacterium]
MKILKGILLLLVLVGGGAGGYAYMTYSKVKAVGNTAKDEKDTKKVPVNIPRGSGPRKIASLLEKSGVIADSEAFYRYLRFVAKKSSALKAGEYELSPSMTTEALIEKLQKGRKKELKFTIPEGLRKEEIAAIIGASGIISEKEILAAMGDKSLPKTFGVPSKGAGGQKGVSGGIEGYLYPDTYQFAKGTSGKAILTKMRKRLDDVVTDKMKARMKELDWSLHKVLTLAAIVEKETGQGFERPMISRVFHNRMKRGMKMQTDPTVIYGIKNYDGNIRKKDLLTHHGYNTYTIKGLPPGPIASAGKAAIEAALWPSKGTMIFFVSKNDGTHVFATTLAEHEHNVDVWQRQYFKKKRRGQ